MLSQIPIPFKIYHRVQWVANFLLPITWYFSNEGLLLWDDFTYIQLAHEINQGTFEVSGHPFSNRIGLVYPTAWAIGFLGINAYSVVVFPLICSLALLNLVFWLGKLTHLWVGMIGGLLLVTDYHLGFFSVHLFPELPLTLCVFVFLVSYYLLLKQVLVPRMAAFVASLALFAGLLIKTTVFFLVPLLVFLWVNDYRQRRNRAFWLVFVFLSTFFFVIYGLWYQEIKGNFFYRFVNIADNHVPMPNSLFDKGLPSILRRLTYTPILSFLNGGFFIPLGLALPGILSLRKKSFRLKEADSFWPVASLMLLIGFWFMSTTWRTYSPIPAETRHITFFIPVLIITAANYWSYKRLPGILLKPSILFIGLFVLFLIPAYRIYHSNGSNFKKEELLVQQYLVGQRENALVVTDALTEQGHSYFYRFGSVSDRYVWFSREDVLDRLFLFEGKRYLLYNPSFFNEDYQDTKKYQSFLKDLEENQIGLELVEAMGDVRLYLLEEQGPVDD